MASLCLPVTLLLVDFPVTCLSAHLVYKYYPYELLGALWLVSFIKVLILAAVSMRVQNPGWIHSRLLYVLTLCLSPTLYQTLRLLVTSHSPELHSGFPHSMYSHLPLFFACLTWDLVSPYVFPKETSKEEGKTNKKNREHFIRLLKYSRPDWLPLSGAFVFLTLALIGEMFIPYYMGRVIDILSTKYKETEFLVNIFFMATFTITSSIFAGCRGGLFMFSLSSLTRRLRLLLFRSVIKQEISFFEATKSGDITSRLSQDTARVSRSIAANVNIALRMLVKCIGVYSFMFSLSWQLTLLTFLSSPLTWMIQKVYNKYHQELVQKIQDSIARSSDVAKEIIESVRTVYSFAAEEEEAKRYEEALQETHSLQTQRDLVTAVYLLLTRLVNLGTQVAMLCYGHHLIQNGFISSGKMVSFILYQMESGHYIRGLVHMLSEITHSAGAAQKVFDYLDREPQVSTSGSLCPDTLHGDFEFKNVTFSYPSRQAAPVLKVKQASRSGDRVTQLAKREMYWIYKLSTLSPIGLNEQFSLIHYM